MNRGPEKPMDWGRISPEYHHFRAGPPASYYARLKERGVGVPGQRLLDIGTGTGVLARAFARAGARVSGIDASPGQVEQAIRAAEDEGLSIDYKVGAAEAIPYDAGTFDAATANQVWHLVDSPRAFSEARRVVKPGGVLVVSDFFWLGRKDAIAAATEDLVLKFNPTWNAYRWNGELPSRPDLREEAAIGYEEAVEFTRESWRGRVRTCRAIGPSLEPDAVARFDRELGRLLERTAPEKFEVLHRVLAHFYRMA